MSVLIKSSVIFFPPNPSAGQSKATEAPDRVGEGEELLFLNRAETPFMGQSLGFSHVCPPPPLNMNASAYQMSIKGIINASAIISTNAAQLQILIRTD